MVYWPASVEEAPVRIDLTKCEKHPIQFDTSITLVGNELDPGRVAGTVEVRIRGSVQRRGQGMLVKGAIDGDGELLCSRCLAPVPWTVSEEFEIELRRPDTELPEELELDDEDLDVTFTTSDELDVAELAAEQIVLALPMRIVCGASCPGHVDLPSDEDGDEIDPRWAPLQELKLGNQD